MKTYQQMSNELDELVAKMEDEATSLDEVVEIHKKATKLIEQMEKALESAKLSIKRISVK